MQDIRLPGFVLPAVVGQGRQHYGVFKGRHARARSSIFPDLRKKYEPGTKIPLTASLPGYIFLVVGSKRAGEDRQMPRPRKCRLIQTLPEVKYFKPRGVPMTNLEEVVLPLEGFEALRLVEIAGLDHDQASEKMNVSRQTFGRILAAARKTLAEAVVLGQALRIDGGNYRLEGQGPNGDSGK
ncbi:MAG: DUF134 domain-containing protein [Pseudomonadota bacterium]